MTVTPVLLPRPLLVSDSSEPLLATNDDVFMTPWSSPRSDLLPPGEPLPPLPGSSRPASPLSRAASLSALQAEDSEAWWPGKHAMGTVTACTVILSTALVLGLLALPFASEYIESGRPPAARKSAAIALMLHNRSAGASPRHSLVVWSGMGHGAVVYSDLRSFSLTSRRWKRLRPGCSSNSSHGSIFASLGRRLTYKCTPGSSGLPGPAMPAARWKAGVDQCSYPRGMLVTSGDSPLRHGDVYGATQGLRLPTLLLHLVSIASFSPALR